MISKMKKHKKTTGAKTVVFRKIFNFIFGFVKGSRTKRLMGDLVGRSMSSIPPHWSWCLPVSMGPNIAGARRQPKSMSDWIWGVLHMRAAPTI
jgi:hypothetical protein